MFCNSVTHVTDRWDASVAICAIARATSAIVACRYAAVDWATGAMAVKDHARRVWDGPPALFSAVQRISPWKVLLFVAVVRTGSVKVFQFQSGVLSSGGPIFCFISGLCCLLGGIF